MSNVVRATSRILLATFMIYAGIGHFSNTTSFLAQVPTFLPEKELVVYLSGVVEIGIGLALLISRKYRIYAGIFLALFYIAVFPGNISQYLTHTSAFGLDTDLARGIRLIFQPILIFWALWCTNALPVVVSKFRQTQN
jgi:uncharacterized membrane protein